MCIYVCCAPARDDVMGGGAGSKNLRANQTIVTKRTNCGCCASSHRVLSTCGLKASKPYCYHKKTTITITTTATTDGAAAAIKTDKTNNIRGLIRTAANINTEREKKRQEEAILHFRSTFTSTFCCTVRRVDETFSQTGRHMAKHLQKVFWASTCRVT